MISKLNIGINNMSHQLVKKSSTGGYENIMPKSWIEAIKDKNTGQTLVEILQGFNMYFLPYNGNTSSTRCLVPTILRKKGLWITYVKYDGNVYTEWYAANEIDDKSWGDNSNWRVGNNTLVGDITISANGNWVINGTETEFRAVGEKGNTPLLRVSDNKLQVSYNLGVDYIDVTNNPVYTKFRWSYTTGDTQNNIVGRILSSVDEGKTWTNMSNDFTNNLHISRYIGANEALPTSGIAEGTIYAKGPTYAADDTSNNNPIYRLWVYAWKNNTLAWQDNGEFQSIAAGIVQETGSNENVVMSQKATSEAIHGILYDVSAHNDGAVFESLQALLSSSNLSTLIPTSVRHGGMTIRFIQGFVSNSDNKYVQYRLMSDSFNTTVVNWQGVDDIPTAGSDNLIKSDGVFYKDLQQELDTTLYKKEWNVTVGGSNQQSVYLNFPAGIYSVLVDNVDVNNSGTYGLYFTAPSAVGISSGTVCRIGYETIISFPSGASKIGVGDINASITQSGKMQLVIKKIDANKSQILQILSGIEKDIIPVKGKYISASINTSGEYTTTMASSRVSHLEPVKYDNDIVIVPESGYAFHVALYNADKTFNQLIINVVDEYSISSGTYFKLTIYKIGDTEFSYRQPFDMMQKVYIKKNYVTDDNSTSDEVIQKIKRNNGTEALPNWEDIGKIQIPIATHDKAGAMSSDDRNQLNPFDEEDISNQIQYEDEAFYRSDLSKGGATNFIGAIVQLNITGKDYLYLNAAPRSGGWCTLTTANDEVLWQTNEASLFPVRLNLSDYPTAGKLYISNQTNVVALPTVKYLTSTTLKGKVDKNSERITNLEKESEITVGKIRVALPNSFCSSDVLAKPSGFDAFSIPINISRNSAGIYGWDINPSRMRIKNSNNATYYVATNGNDSNDGLTKSTPLKTIEQALSKSDVNTIVLLNGTFINGINFTAGCVVNKDVNILGMGVVIIKSTNNQQPIKIKSAIYVENIIFDGGYYAIINELTDELCVFNKCKFINSSGEYGNGFNALGGRYVLNECEASYNMRDGFGYKSNSVNNVTYYPEVVEINCYGYYNGIADTNYINNCSTMHELGGKIIRIYCEYGMSKGVVVADADGAYSLNYSVVAYSTSNIDGADNRKGNFGSQGANSKVWLYDCISHGSKYDIVTDNNCTIYTTDRYSNELNNGTIVDIQ